MSVESSVVLPSVSSPSSDMSVTLLLCPGEDAVTVTLFFTDDVVSSFALLKEDWIICTSVESSVVNTPVA